MAHEYSWPLGNDEQADEMNTSFGPRIDMNRWDFHDGIDLPAEKGTKVHAMRGGTVQHAGPGGSGGYSSRHVVIKVDVPAARPIYNVYLHLDSIDPAVATGGNVGKGQVIGKVGDDDATYPHLHFEFRRGSYKEEDSVHPLSYLPYTDSANFSPPGDARFNWLDGYMAARILFRARDKRQGDLKKVKVDLLRGNQVITTRVVDFDDKRTVNDSKGDAQLFVDDIGVEGYQKSNMILHERADLSYGIVVRKIPRRCDALVAHVIDVAGHEWKSDPIALPDRVATHDAKQKATDEFLDFENGQLPPERWKTVDSGNGTGVTITSGSAHSGRRALRCVDESTTEAGPQRAGVERALPPGRFEWRTQAWFKPIDMGLRPDQWVYLLFFRSGQNLSVAARIRNYEGTLRAGLRAKNPDGTFESDDGPIIELNRWRRWRLELLRVGTRETTAILYLGNGGHLTEQARVDWDSSTREPTTFRAGVSLSAVGATATLLLDELWLTESAMST